MAEKPSNSDSYKLPIPQPLQDAVDEIALNSPLVTAIPADLDDNKKRWLVVGICLHSIIAPALRNFISPILSDLYNQLKSDHKIDTQIYPTHLEKYSSNFFLNYAAVNNNKAKYGYQKKKYDYTIKNAVELSKLFQLTHMAQYTGFDETCETSGLLELVITIDKFAPDLKIQAGEVKRNVRNPWAHCDFTKWDAAMYSNAFSLMEKLVLDMSLSSNEEKEITGKLEQWKVNGEQFLSGTTVGLELVNEIRQQTCVLGEFSRQVATGTDENFTKINNEIEKIKILLNDKIYRLTKDMEDIDKRVKAQDNILKYQHTQLRDVRENFKKCACHDSHNVVIKGWEEQEVMFVETPVVEDILQILESEHSVLIVGEPGIGKSMLMHHIALFHKISYSLIPCSKLQDIDQHYKEDTRQMFVFDDVFGRFTASVHDFDHLHKQKEFVKRILEKGKTKILATCRLEIYRVETIHELCKDFKFYNFDLSVEYSRTDQLNICRSYLTETDIKLLEDQHEAFTPLMCYLYSKNENFNLTDFFHCPFETYQKEWEIFRTNDPYKYCALFLFVIFNGIIKESLFDIYNENTEENRDVLEIIFETCDIDRGTSRNKIIAIFKTMIGTYLQKTGNEYRIIHDHMFDFLCAYFGNKDSMIRSILRYADIRVFNERTQLEFINEKHGKFTIMVPTKYERDYFGRIHRDIQLGKLKHCFCNSQIGLEKYRILFLKELESIDDNFLIKQMTIDNGDCSDTDSYDLRVGPLISSCLRGYYDIVEYFISKGVDLKEAFSISTPLTAACGGGNEKIVQLLVDKGCNIYQVDGLGRTPMTSACMGTNENIVQLLIDKGIGVNQVDNSGKTPLKAAFWGGNEKIVQLLLDKGSDLDVDGGMVIAALRDKEKIVQLLIDNRLCSNEVPESIVIACNRGNKKILQLLIDFVSDDRKQKLLKMACKSGHEDLVNFLIDKGCDVNHDGYQQTPLINAIKGENTMKFTGPDIFKMNEFGQPPQTNFIKKRYEKVVKLLIDKGCNVKQRPFGGEYPLNVACRRGNEMIVQLLIDNESEVNKADMIGTPLTVACWKGNEKMIHSLIGSKNIDVNQVGFQDLTPLSVACRLGNLKIARLLIGKGCDINQAGQAPLTYACESGNERLVKLLIDKDSDINQEDNFRGTPLTAACGKRNENLVHLLISKGSDVNKKCRFGPTPLTNACGQGNEKIVQLLIDKGSDINKVDSRRNSPLTAACECGDENIVRLLIAKGCDVYQTEGITQTPLQAAYIGQNEKIIELLKDEGCVYNEVDDLKDTFLTAFSSCVEINENIVPLLYDERFDVYQTPLSASAGEGNEEGLHSVPFPISMCFPQPF